VLRLQRVAWVQELRGGALGVDSCWTEPRSGAHYGNSMTAHLSALQFTSLVPGLQAFSHDTPLQPTDPARSRHRSLALWRRENRSVRGLTREQRRERIRRFRESRREREVPRSMPTTEAAFIAKVRFGEVPATRVAGVRLRHRRAVGVRAGRRVRVRRRRGSGCAGRSFPLRHVVATELAVSGE
jgi:hypothetical protein